MSIFSKWIDKNILGTQDPNAARNKILSNPYLDKWNEMSDEYKDFNSDYYKQGKSFFADMYGNQAQDSLATQANMNNRAMAMGGGSQGIGFAQNDASRARAMNQAYGQTNKSLMDMWQQGQQLSGQYGDRAAGLYNQANQAYLNTDASNKAARAQGMQGLLGLGVKGLMPGLSGLMSMRGLKGMDNPYMDLKDGKMQQGQFTPWQSFRYGYMPRRGEE